MSPTPPNATPPKPPPAWPRPEGTGVMEGGEPLPFDWSVFVPLLLHPVKVAVIEALRWVGEPLSAIDFRELFAAEELSTPFISYHVREMGKAGVLAQVGMQQVRGATKRLYFFPPE